MKKITTTLCLLALSLAMKSQMFDIRGFGGMGLVSLSTAEGKSFLNGSTYKNTVEIETPLFQFGAAITIGERFFVQPGVTWQSVQFKYTSAEIGGSKTKYEDEVLLKMITVPIKVGLRILDPEKIKLFNIRLFGGIDGQIITGVEHKTKSSLNLDFQESDFNSLITYGDVGMGIDILFIFADLGYRIGLTPVNNSGDNSKANMLYGNVGIRIKL